MLLVYGIIQGGDTGTWLAAGRARAPSSAGLAALAVFIWYEGEDNASVAGRPAVPRQPAPVVGRRPRSRWCSSPGMGGVYFFISFYTQNVRGYNPLHAGLLTISLALLLA